MSGSDAGAGRPGPKAITVRLDERDYERLQDYADSKNMSLNAVVNDAVAKYVGTIRRRQTLQLIEVFRNSSVMDDTPGEQAVEVIARLRKERAEHLYEVAHQNEVAHQTSRIAGSVTPSPKGGDPV